MKQKTLILLLVVGTLFLWGCADKINVQFPENAYEYGFFWGLWHGFIAPFSLIGMLFGADITVFAMKNTGFFYALGFLMGSGGWGVLASKAKSKRNK